MMPVDYGFFDLIYHSPDSSNVLREYIEFVANKKLLLYKHIIHTGGKTGESLWSHLMNLVTIIEKLRPLFNLEPDEMCCLLLALTIHDLNKDDVYGKLPNGRRVKYADAVTAEHIDEALEALEVTPFFPEWRRFHFDILYLAQAHQEQTSTETQHNQWKLDQCQLDMDRLEGPLTFLMKAADVSDNSHSGDHMKWHEKHIRDKLRNHINTALNDARHSRRYRFIGHRLAEQRGLFTNVIHNQIVSYFLDTYGSEACIDLLYHPEGVDYLLDKRVLLDWNPKTLRTVAEKIGQKFADLQFDQRAQFVKATPSGIVVDDAAIQSGASVEELFSVIAETVKRKQYRLEWQEQRNTLVRADLNESLSDNGTSDDLKERITLLLREHDLIATEEDVLKQGEFVMAYRNFLKEHRADQLKAIKQDAWTRVARLSQLPEESDAVYKLIDPYRRGYCMARDLPNRTIEDMTQDALTDLAELESQAAEAITARKAKKAISIEVPQATSENEGLSLSFDSAYIVDYLERHLEVWDSASSTSDTSHTSAISDTRPIQIVDFAESLRRYADPKRQHKQCCYCGNALKANEWAAIQVPPSIGVQVFSNRLEGGSARDPMRNVCDICRMQYILWKLAWRSHRDKQGGEQVTFYLHFFPYSYFTRPMLQAWWQSIQQVRNGDHTALFLDTKTYFREREQAYQNMQVEVSTHYYYKGNEGVGIPMFSEAINNTPILPLIVSGSNYGKQFLTALEKTALLARWFDCRVILSRLPVPLLNLANESIGQEPVALLVENAPRSMSWLVPQAALTRTSVETLCKKLSKIHQLAERLSTKDDLFDDIVYDLAVAASEDPLALYQEADRLIEQHATRKKGKPEYQAIDLSHAIAPLLKEVTAL